MTMTTIIPVRITHQYQKPSGLEELWCNHHNFSEKRKKIFLSESLEVLQWQGIYIYLSFMLLSFH